MTMTSFEGPRVDFMGLTSDIFRIGQLSLGGRVVGGVLARCPAPSGELWWYWTWREGTVRKGLAAGHCPFPLLPNSTLWSLEPGSALTRWWRSLSDATPPARQRWSNLVVAGYSRHLGMHSFRPLFSECEFLIKRKTWIFTPSTSILYPCAK